MVETYLIRSSPPGRNTKHPMLLPLVFPLLIPLLLAPAALAQAPADHPLVRPGDLGMSALVLARLDAFVRAHTGVAFPGAALAVGRGGAVVVESGFGRIGWEEDAPAVDPDFTVYDLASLTKVMATTSAVMLLFEAGRIDLDAPVQRYLPHWWGEGKAGVTLRHLLTHTSGLPAGSNIGAPDAASVLRRALEVPLVRGPGERVEYSDIGFIVLWAAAEAAAEEPLYRLLDRRVFGPLAMRSATFLPGEGCTCAPTERLRDGSVIRGRVHDPNARRLGGVAGHAGLFATAHDVAVFAAMLAREGEYGGERIFWPETVRYFTTRQPDAGTRALGWDTANGSGRNGASGARMSPRGYGHTGFTGTSLWIDPDRRTWSVLLSNRTYEPRGGNQIQAVRRGVHDLVTAAVDEALAVAAR
jgi:CubicO group peptidase (beta-lactamase class C family)